MLKRIYKIFAILLSGFAGGAITPWVLGWLKAVAVGSPSDAVAIANTYIVFTTIIFVGVTVVLAIAGYVFTQQFSASKEAQELSVMTELKERIKSDEVIGIALADALIQNVEVQRHLENRLLEKIDEVIKSRLADVESSASQAVREAEAVRKIASQLQLPE